jgi:hypothetical protein
MGTPMSSVSRYREYAADCARQAQTEISPDEKTIMLGVALAWLRLAQQTEAREDRDQVESPPVARDLLDERELSS